MSKWVPAWSCTTIDYNHPVGHVEDVTQTGIFMNNVDGNKVRLRLNNLYNVNDLKIAHADIATRNRVTGKKSALFPITLNGQEEIVIPANTEPLSDEIALTVTHEDDFIVTMYFAEPMDFYSVSTTTSAMTWRAMQQAGDYRAMKCLMPRFGKPPISEGLSRENLNFTIGLSAIQVETDSDITVICAFGDSITHMGLYSEPLTKMLYKAYPGKYTVYNAGISGNRINRTFPVNEMFPSKGHQFGIAGKDRFMHDVYTNGNPDIVFMMIGVNDTSHSIIFKEPTVETAEEIYAAMKLVADMAHEKGSKIYGSTITPYGGVGQFWREPAEAMRCAVNDLIRTGNATDDFVDMDAALRDPEDTHFMQDGMHMGDWVHPNCFGGEKIAQTIFDKWFK